MEKVGAYTERATAEGEWRPGDPATGQQATPMLSAYFNMLQREMLAVLSDVGVVPDINTTHDFIKEIESGKYDDLKDKPVVTYCTGGIRCEILSSLMINRGFQEVYQIDGGIVRYGEKFGNQGLWEGSLYVFDKRMHMEFGEDYKRLGHCIHCDTPTNKFEHCVNEDECRQLVLMCPDCYANVETRHCGQDDCVEIAADLAARGVDPLVTQ